MTFLFRVLAVALGAAAVYFYWTDSFDWAFAFTAFAICSYFFGMRFQIKARIAARQAAEEAVANGEPPV